MTDRTRSDAALKAVTMALILALITVSTGHVGRLFADRENATQRWLGYAFAFAVDGVLALSLYNVGRLNERSHRAFALVVFVLACAVSGGFNTAYYRQNYPQDPWALSLALGNTAPILAALVTVMRALGDRHYENKSLETKEQDKQREHELELERIAQAGKTERVVGVEAEHTKQERARARYAKPTAPTPVKSNGHKRSFSDFEAAIVSGELSLDMTGTEIGQWAGKSPATGRKWRKKYQEAEEASE